MSRAKAQRSQAGPTGGAIHRKRVTLEDIGERLGLSGRAVSQALGAPSGTVRISEETREKVVKLAKQLGYRHNRAARTLRNGRSNLIGVLCEKSANYLELQRLHAATAAIRNAGLTPFVYSVTSNADSAHNDAIDILLDQSVDGILSFSFNQRDVERLSHLGIPCCSIDRYSISRDSALYMSDKQAAFEDLAMHLLQQGCKRLTFLSSPCLPSKPTHASALLKGFLQADKNTRRSHPGTTFTHHTFGPDTISDARSHDVDLHPLCTLGYFGMLDIIASGDLPDAVLCINDNAAFGAMRACTEHEIRIPTDIAISGFDNDPISSAGPIPLTSIAYPLEELARLAVAELVRANSSGTPPRKRTTILPCRPIVRMSTLRS